MHFFGYGNLFEPHVNYHRADADGALTVSRPLDVPALTLMHDFALTAGMWCSWICRCCSTWTWRSAALSAGFTVPLGRPAIGARLGVLRRDDPYGGVRWFDVDPCFVFHIANAYDRRGLHRPGGAPVSRDVARQQ